jgi:hypothetical protein
MGQSTKIQTGSGESPAGTTSVTGRMGNRSDVGIDPEMWKLVKRREEIELFLRRDEKRNFLEIELAPPLHRERRDLTNRAKRAAQTDGSSDRRKLVFLAKMSVGYRGSRAEC